MAALTGPAQAFNGDTSVLDTAAKHTLGTRAMDASGNTYIYLLGIASTVEGSWVTYDLSSGATTLIVANAIGPVAIAKAATVASTYGWYLVDGYTATSGAGAATADNAALYIQGSGVVDDAAVNGDLIYNAVSRSSSSGSGNIAAEIHYPFCNDVVVET